MLRKRFVVLALVFIGGALSGWFFHERMKPSRSPSDTGWSSADVEASAELSPGSSRVEAALPASHSEDSIHRPQRMVDSGDSAPDVRPELPEGGEAGGPGAQATATQPDPARLFAAGDLSSPPDAGSATTDGRSKLHSAYRLTCQFDPGVSAVATGGAIQTTTASWQGEVIGLDVLDAEAGRATMNGTAGATGSSTGSVEMRMVKTEGGLTFSSIVPRGDLITMTVFSQTNERREFLAVMSTHTTRTAAMASQFYGACFVP